MNVMSAHRHSALAFLTLIAGLGCATSIQAGTAFVRNPSFEDNYNPESPHYLQGVADITDWVSSPAYGVNTASGPFHNGGTPVPDGRRVAFKQGAGTISQDIAGLTPGARYWLQFRYDRRNSADYDLTVRFADVELDRIVNPRMVTGGAPYYFRNVVFTPEVDYGTLTFAVTAYGDSTALLDAVTIVQRDEDNFVVQNPSFEASGTVYEGAPAVGTDWPAVSGWAKTGIVGVDDGTGGYADNGEIPDQAVALFIEGVGSVAQTLDPLVVNDDYRVEFAYNARAGTTPHLQLVVGGAVIWEQDVMPVGGTAAYRKATVTFKAAEETSVISFANTLPGSAVLLDDIKVIGRTGSKLPPIAITPLTALLRVGEQAGGTVSIPAERLASGDAVIRLRSERTNVAALVGADANGVLSLTFGNASAPTTPPAGAKLWLKADAITGMANGARLASWADSSGNANDASQATEANQPTFVANGLNNLPTVRFDDLDADGTVNGVQFLDSKATVQTKAGASYTALLVFRSDDTGVSAGALEGRDSLLQPLDLDTSANRGRTVLFIDSDASANHRLQSVSAQASLVASGTYTPGTWALATVLQDVSAATLSLFVNGSVDRTVPIGTEGGQNGPWRLGATKQGHGGLAGEVAELLVYDRALSPAEREAAERYLGKKWGLPGATSQPYSFAGVGVGNASVQVIDTAGLLPPTDVPALFVANSSFVLNPSFELDKDSGVGSTPVAGWTTAGGIGIANAANPFGPAADAPIPDRAKVLRVQGSGTVSQAIKGLKPGQEYGLQFFYNGRTYGYPYEMALQVSFAGQQILDLQGVAPASDAGLSEYFFQEVRFTPGDATGLLEFKVVVTSGDATLFLDAVSIVPRLPGEITVMNSSFEGTAMGAAWPGYIQPSRIAGWGGARNGYGPNGYSPKTFFVEPFFDNGINSDQDNVIFLQGGGSLEQIVGGLQAEQPYTLVFDYNGRDGREHNTSGAFPETTYELYLDEALIDTRTFEPVNSSSPWPGFLHTLPLYQAFVPFTPFADTVALRIAHVVADPDQDRTLLVDNVRVVPGTRTPPAMTQELADQTAKEGDTVTFTTSATGDGLAYRWLLDGVQLADGASISGATTQTLTLTKVPLQAAGTYTVLVTDGLGVVGSAAALTVEPAPIEPPTFDTIQVVNGNLVLTWTGNARLLISSDIASPIAQWQEAPGANTVSPYSVPVAQIPGNVVFARLVAQ
ncbi:MAG TPA: hypothetical protein PKM73_06300 [Verrucomicrobiota bacterium]|nr:hypothetical protein [Verrucomicrobiota bacterium]HNU51164.1 hypothetical protein [Verrucomicrobiota bacterium]